LPVVYAASICCQESRPRSAHGSSAQWHGMQRTVCGSGGQFFKTRVVMRTRYPGVLVFSMPSTNAIRGREVVNNRRLSREMNAQWLEAPSCSRVPVGRRVAE